MLVFWGRIKGISANIKLVVSGSSKDLIIQQTGRLKDALRNVDDFLEDLEDELVVEARVVERLLPAESEWTLSRIHESILLIYKFHINRVNNITCKWWTEHVRGESIRGGGKLFKYIFVLRTNSI